MKKRFHRRAKRYSVSLQVVKLNGQETRNTFVVDISSLGARLETDMPLAPRNLVEISVLFPEHTVETRLSGKVMWMRPLIEKPGRFQMGLQFFSPQWDVDRLAEVQKV